MIFEELAAFKKDVKGLGKKYRSIPSDLEVVKQVLNVSAEERPPFSYRIDHLHIATCVIKVKKIACRSLKGRGVNSGLRLVYAYFSEEMKVVFIELYHKSEQSTENRNRITENFQ